jgi:hypothetical protein
MYKSRDTEELLAEARRISNIGRFLPRDYARCTGIGKGTIICDRTETCLRFVDPASNTENLENASWFRPELKIGESGCKEFIGDE